MFSSLSYLIAAACAAISVAAFPNQTYVTENFIAPGLEISVAGKTAPGFLFYGVVGKGYVDPAPIIMHNDGSLVWYGGAGLITHNFKVQSFNGQDVLSYWSGFTDHFGHGYGSVFLLDNTYSTIAEVCLQENIVTPHPNAFPGDTANPCFFDSHESFITRRGTVIATAFNVTQADLTAFNGPSDGWVFDALFYEVDIATGAVLFSWSAMDHIPLTESNYLGKNPDEPLKIGRQLYGHSQANPWDFFHINSVQPVDGGYIVNSRMTWSFYMVNGKSGAVDWTLEGSNGGDFTLAPGIFWSWQHDPRLLVNTAKELHISLFNNDNINSIVFGVNASTGYHLNVNLATKHVTSLHKFKDRADPVFASAEGSYQVLPNANVLLGYGSAAIIKEFDPAGKVVYNAAFAPLTNADPDEDGGKDVHSYRAYRFNWSAAPTTKPKAAAFFSANNASTTVYMSWNGATAFRSWNIYAGPDATSLRRVASRVPRVGFETNTGIRDHGGLNFVQVEAVGAGESRSFSEVVAIQQN